MTETVDMRPCPSCGKSINADATRCMYCFAKSEAIRKVIEPFIVEAEPIDHRAIFAQAEDARPFVALLRTRRDGAALHEAKARRKQRVRRFAVFVEAGGHADWIG